MFRFSGIGFRFMRKGKIPIARDTRSFPNLNYLRGFKKVPSGTLTVIGEPIFRNDESDYLSGDSSDEEIVLDSSKRLGTLEQPIKDIIRSYGKKIDWDGVIKRCNGIPRVRNISDGVIKGFIVDVCEKEEMFDAITSYFKYLIKKKQLCMGLLYIICETISRNEEKLSQCIELIYKIYFELPERQTLPINICLPILLRSEKYKQKVIHTLENMNKNPPGRILIESSFKANDMDTAFKILEFPSQKYFTDTASSFTLPKYFDYFHRMADAGEIPVTRFVLFFNKVVQSKIHTVSEEVIKSLRDLFFKLNKLDHLYMWSFQEISPTDKCRLCSAKLKKMDISDEEIGILRDNFEKKIVVGNNINITSDQLEWNKFTEFLKKESYDIVIDGLNVIYTFSRDVDTFMNILKILKEMELTPLILARHHFYHSEHYYLAQKTCKIFLTHNLSHDDVFVLYASLFKGKNCYYMSQDRMGFAKVTLENPQLQQLYSRWQGLHQVVVSEKEVLLPAGLPLGLQKSPSEDENEFRYHLVLLRSSFRKVYCISRLKIS